MRHLAETTRPSYLLLVSWYVWFYLTLYSLSWNQTLKWMLRYVLAILLRHKLHAKCWAQQGSIHSFQAYDTVLSLLTPVHYLDCQFFTGTKKYRWKTNSQDRCCTQYGVVCLETMDRSLLSSTFILPCLTIINSTSESLGNLSRNVKKDDFSFFYSPISLPLDH
jgi:hypothetical protein